MNNDTFSELVSLYAAQHGIKRLPLSRRGMRKIDVCYDAAHNARYAIPADVPRSATEKSKGRGKRA